MNNEQKFNKCLEAAKVIVSNYRKDAPKGFDPQNSWVAVGTTAVSVGGSVLSSSLSGGGGGGGTANRLSNSNLQYNPITYDTDELLADRKGLYGTKMKPVKYKSTVPNTGFDPWFSTNMLSSVMGAGPEGSLNDTANFITQQNKFRRESVAPGAAQMMSQGGDAINSWLRGEISPDVARNIAQATAQVSGGSNNPFAPGRTNAQNNLSRNLGRTSDEIQTRGVNAASTWQQLAQSLITTPDQLFGLSSDIGRQKYAYDVLNVNTALEQDSRNYSANMTNAQIAASPDPQSVGFLNDFLKLQGLNNTGRLQSAELALNAQLGGIEAETARMAFPQQSNGSQAVNAAMAGVSTALPYLKQSFQDASFRRQGLSDSSWPKAGLPFRQATAA